MKMCYDSLFVWLSIKEEGAAAMECKVTVGQAGACLTPVRAVLRCQHR